MKNVLIIILLLMSMRCYTQDNLIANPSFEDYYDVEYDFFTDNLDVIVVDWHGRLVSGRYHNLDFGEVPTGWEIIEPQHGKGIMVLINILETPSVFDRREYIESILLDTLKAGKSYFLSYHLSLPFSDHFALSDYGIHFSNTYDDSTNINFPYEQLLVDPIIEIDTVPNLAHNRWNKFTHCFTPEEDYTVMTAGIFEAYDSIQGIENTTFERSWIAYDNFLLAEIEQDLQINISKDTICSGDCIELSSNHSLFDGDFEWLLPGSDVLISDSSFLTVCYDTPGQFNIAARVSHCGGNFESSPDVFITVLAGIDVEIDSDTLVCANEIVYLEFEESYDSIHVNDKLSENPIAFHDEGFYEIRISQAGCQVELEYQIEYYSQEISEAIVKSCPGDTSLFRNLILSDPGIYYDTLKNNQDCDSIVYKIDYAHYVAEQNIFVEKELVLCEGDVELIQIDSEFNDIEWNDGVTSAERMLSTYGHYSVRALDKNGCEVFDEINVIPSPISIITQDLEDIVFDGPLNLPIIYEGEIISYNWNMTASLSCANCPFPNLIKAVPGDYVVEIVDKNNCMLTGSIKVSFDIPQIYIPNAINTGSQDSNNAFLLFSDKDMTYSLHIYDRWGNLIYQKNDAKSNEKKDGWTPSRELSQGVYTYLIEYQVDSEIEKKSGSITIFH